MRSEGLGVSREEGPLRAIRLAGFGAAGCEAAEEGRDDAQVTGGIVLLIVKIQNTEEGKRAFLFLRKKLF